MTGTRPTREVACSLSEVAELGENCRRRTRSSRVAGDRAPPATTHASTRSRRRTSRAPGCLPARFQQPACSPVAMRDRVEQTRERAVARMLRAREARRVVDSRQLGPAIGQGTRRNPCPWGAEGPQLWGPPPPEVTMATWPCPPIPSGSTAGLSSRRLFRIRRSTSAWGSRAPASTSSASISIARPRCRSGGRSPPRCARPGREAHSSTERCRRRSARRDDRRHGGDLAERVEDGHVRVLVHRWPSGSLKPSSPIPMRDAVTAAQMDMTLGT